MTKQIYRFNTKFEGGIEEVMDRLRAIIGTIDEMQKHPNRWISMPDVSLEPIQDESDILDDVSDVVRDAVGIIDERFNRYNNRCDGRR